jgi:hypothetical protein
MLRMCATLMQATLDRWWNGRRAQPVDEEPDVWDVIKEDIHAGTYGFYSWSVRTEWRLPRGTLWDSVLLGKTRLFGDLQEWRVDWFINRTPWRVWE